MALVMQLRSRCKKGCQCENGTTFHGKNEIKSTKPVETSAQVNSTCGNRGVSPCNCSPPILKDTKSNKNSMKRNSKGKMSSHNPKITKENQNCKAASRKVNNKRASPGDCPRSDPEVPVKVHKFSNSRRGKEQTKCLHQKLVTEGPSRKPKKLATADVVVAAAPASKPVPKRTCGIVKSARERTRRNPPRKCVLDSQCASRQTRPKLALTRQASSQPGRNQKQVCESLCIEDIQKQVPSTSASFSVASIKRETHNITVKTKEIEKEVAQLQDQLNKENAQIAKLQKFVAKRQTARSYVDRKKELVQQAESKKLIRQLDRKESQMEQRTTQLERRLKETVQSNQREMQKFKKQLSSDWQKKVSKTQRAITKMRNELRTKVLSWKKEKEALECRMEKDLEGQKKMGSQHKFYKVCERQLKRKQAELEKQKVEVEKGLKSKTDKTAGLKIDAELSELKTYMNLLAMAPKEHMKAAAKRKEKEGLSQIIEEDLQCTICSEILMQATVLNCCHTFCKHCITRWTKRRDHCPVCRTTITTKFNLENLDRFIDKVVEKFDNAFKERRKKALEDRKDQERQLRVQEETGYFDEHSDDDSSDDDFWDVWDGDDDDDDLSMDLDDDDEDDSSDDEGAWDDWDDDDDDADDGDTSTDGDFDDDSDDNYDCVIC